MDLANQTIYFGFGLIFFGLGFNSFHDLQSSFSLQSPKHYWFLSIGAMTVSSFAFASQPLWGPFVLIIAYAAQFAADIFLLLLFRSLNVRIKKDLILGLAIGFLISLPLLDFIQNHRDYDLRVLFISGISIFLSAWQLHELFIQYRREKSIYLGFIILAISSQIVMWVYRIWVADHYLDMGSHQSIFDEYLPEFLARIFILVSYALIFIALGNYYYEILWRLEKKRRQDKEDQMLQTLNSLAHARDNETGQHIIRTKQYVRALANRLIKMKCFLNQLNEKAVQDLYKAAPLHDIGKVAIPDYILLKEGRLNEEEWEIMKTHASIGASVLSNSSEQLGYKDRVIEYAINIAGSHHEKWDGTGYPLGRKGEDIPLEARIMSLADMYDALVTKRVYKDNWTHDEAVAEIIRQKGVHLDPAVVEAFILEKDHFKEIAERHKD